jgi:pimeloyl-ACP methyl ester carboxylesterase
MRLRLVVAAAAVLGAAAPAAAVPAPRHVIGFRVFYRYLVDRHDALVRRFWVPYRAWNGDRREALLLLPAWYGPHLHPPIPLVISPHGRGGTAAGNARYWGDLPAFGPFAVVNPQGQGRRLIAYSWGWRGQISDLARMPAILERRLPWLRLDRRRTYAIGSSMGGQETLLLDAQHPRLLAGAVALDSATDMAARYRAFEGLDGGWELRRRMRAEVGGTPASDPSGYEQRSPIDYARRLATDRVPLFIWWSRHDHVIRDQYAESGCLYRTIERINPGAPVYEVVGDWDHSAEMRPMTQLPEALVEVGLIHVDVRMPRLSHELSVQVPMRSMPASLSIPGDVAQSLRSPAGPVVRVPGWRSSTA